jgi:predicted nucleotidyltransferase component of viral defense system
MNKSNIEHSVRQKLLNVSISKDVDYNIVLIWYGLERFLYRLSKSRYSDQFILKGAMLFAVWAKQPLRPTKDLDLMAYGDASAGYLTKVFTEICQTKVDDDGIVFDTNGLEINEIMEEQEYDGQRVKLLAKLGNAKIRLQIDIGFGDVVTPAPAKIQYPVLLESSVPLIKAYPKETVVAEKLHAMVIRGIANSRMKDFYDLWIMSKQFDFDGSLLTEAIAATFERRKTPLPDDVPVAFTKDFSSDTNISQRWRAFANKLKQSSDTPQLNQIIGELKDFLIVPLQYAKAKKVLNRKWSATKWEF